MTHNKIILGLIIIVFLILTAGCIGPQPSEPKRYYGDKEHSVILFPDGTFQVVQPLNSFSGEWKIADDKLFLSNVFGTITFIVINNTAIQNENGIWYYE